MVVTLSAESIGRVRAANPCLWLLAAAACGGATSCGTSLADTMDIEGGRVASSPSRNVEFGVSLAERMGARSPEKERQDPQQQPPSPRLDHVVPDGWTQLDPSGFRFVNLKHSTEPTGELYLTFLQSDGGGLGPNVNRWRNQAGLEPLTDVQIAALPSRTILGAPATYVEAFGSFTGMDGVTSEDAGIIGAITAQGNGTLFVKMTGPVAFLETEREHFDEFLASLEIVDARPPQTPPAAPPSPVAWDAPEGWATEPGNGFREVTFRKGDVQIWISLASGGVLPNVNRWAGQVGMPALDEAALAQLPRVPMMEREGYVFEGVGTLSASMREAPRADQRMLAAIVEGGGRIVTVKATGPNADVDAARDVFMSIVASLRRADNEGR